MAITNVLIIMFSIMSIMLISSTQAQRFNGPIEYVGRNNEWGISFLNNTPSFEVFATDGSEVAVNESDPSGSTTVNRLDEYMQFVLASVREKTGSGIVVFEHKLPLTNCELARTCFWEITTDTSYGTNSPTHSVRFRGFFLLKGTIIIQNDIYDDKSSRAGLEEGSSGSSNTISSVIVPGQTVAVRISLKDWTFETNDTQSFVEIVFDTAFHASGAGSTAATSSQSVASSTAAASSTGSESTTNSTGSTSSSSNSTGSARSIKREMASEKQELGSSTGLISINQNGLVDGQTSTVVVNYKSGGESTADVPYFASNATFDGIYFTIYTTAAEEDDENSSSGIGAKGGVVIGVVLGVLCLLAILAIIIFVLIIMFGKKIVESIESRRKKDTRT